jgi:ABC-type Mn2+/Zn2+ transport system ATPase subunit
MGLVGPNGASKSTAVMAGATSVSALDSKEEAW